MSRRARDVMTRRVVTVRNDAPVSAAVERMTRYGFSAIPVVDAAYRLVGIISLLDVLRYRQEADTGRDVPVDAVMTRDVLSMSPTTSTAVVAHRLRTYGELRVMPIVENRVLVGVVTRSDLLAPRDRPSWSARLLRRLRGGDSAEDEELLRLARPRRPGPAPGPTTPIRRVMTTDVVTVGVAQPVEEAARLLLRHRHTALPVVEGDGRLIGVLSEADLLGDPVFSKSVGRTVGSAMTRDPITLDVGATVADARAMLTERGLRLLPVVENGRLVGVLGRSDLV